MMCWRKIHELTPLIGVVEKDLLVKQELGGYEEVLWLGGWLIEKKMGGRKMRPNYHLLYLLSYCYV